MRKILKLLAVLFLILFLLMLVPGMVKPDLYYSNAITVNASAEEAFSIFKDTSVMKQWITGLTHFEYIEGTMDAPGSKWKLLLNQDGKLYEMTETLTAYEENKRFAFLMDNEVLTTEVDIRFTPSSQGTIISVNNIVTGKNLLLRSLFVLTGSYFRNESQKMYENLKLIIDKSQVPA